MKKELRLTELIVKVVLLSSCNKALADKLKCSLQRLVCGSSWWDLKKKDTGIASIK